MLDEQVSFGWVIVKRVLEVRTLGELPRRPAPENMLCILPAVHERLVGTMVIGKHRRQSGARSRGRGYPEVAIGENPIDGLRLRLISTKVESRQESVRRRKSREVGRREEELEPVRSHVGPNRTVALNACIC